MKPRYRVITCFDDHIPPARPFSSTMPADDDIPENISSQWRNSSCPLSSDTPCIHETRPNCRRTIGVRDGIAPAHVKQLHRRYYDNNNNNDKLVDVYTKL